MTSEWMHVLEKVDDHRWEIPLSYKSGMRVPGLVIADERMIRMMGDDQAFEQVANVATLPGIVGRSLAMPDIHWGYGFPVGGVAAFDVEGGVISPGGVGYDINCGVRLLRTDLTEADVQLRVEDLAETLFQAVPSGVGVGGRFKVGMGEIDHVLKHGARWAVTKGYGVTDDLDVIEAGGALDAAEPDAVSQEAKQRGRGQIGTLGSGNHFLEVQVVDEVFHAPAAQAFGIEGPGQVVVFIHTGSRGLGHQVCTDYLRVSDRAGRQHGIHLVDRQLACMPLQSAEGQRYFGAMSAAANFAWANRQLVTHWVREGFERVFGRSWEHLGVGLVYDVAHNIGKIEEYEVEGRMRRLCVHRKGATRAFPAGHAEVPARYRHVGQPVFVPGDMGRYSFVAVGAEAAMRESFGSTCHGAGRVLGRKAAVRQLAGRDIAGELRRAGIVVRARDRSLLSEEASAAYKDVADVVGICHAAGLSRRVARMRPICVVKG